MIATAAARHRKRPTVSAVTHEGSTSAQGVPAGGATVTMPAGASVGSLAIFAVAHNENRTHTPPAGLTKVYDSDLTNNSQEVHSGRLCVYTKTVSSGEPGVATFNFGLSGSGTGFVVQVGLSVYGNCAGLAGAIRDSIQPGGDQANGRVTILPAFWSTSDKDRIVAANCAIADVTGSTDPSGCSVVNLPPGWTSRVNQHGRASGLGNTAGVAIFDKAGGFANFQEEAVSAGQMNANNCESITAVIPLRPVGQSESHYEKPPSSLVGGQMYGYGTSRSCYIIRKRSVESDAPQFCSMNPHWWLLKNAINPATFNNWGIGGINSANVATYAFGEESATTQAAVSIPNTGPFVKSQVGTWLSTVRGGIVFCNLFDNDMVGELSPQAQVRGGALIAGEAVCRLLRASAFIGPVHASISYSADWDIQSGLGFATGNAYRTLVAGRSVTISTTEPAIDVVLIAMDDEGFAVGGSTFNIYVDGVLFKTDTTSNKIKYFQSPFAGTDDWDFCQWTIPIEFSTGGTHTVEIVKTQNGTESQLIFNGYLTRKTTNIPWIVLEGQPTWTPDGYSSGQVTVSGNNFYDNLNETIAALFPDGKVMAYHPRASGLWDLQGHADYQLAGSNGVKAFSGDQLHFNDVGENFYAKEMLRFLRERIP